ncbi:MAG: hypothetical protein D8M58_03595 [Calditrichaeota bacterium]|nr:MAG: hypothetical protein DWQ03_03480 [Calditrichota bacterium]MBL1204450.1 hypothetical protein [Calditrichota bacterium]NOG44279.1 hypothetical protein [Calditrichota bacterium]
MRLIFIALITIALLLRCEAPRVNPFDPNGDNYQGDTPTLSDTKFYSIFENFNSRTTLMFQTQINSGQINNTVTNASLKLNNFIFEKELDISINDGLPQYHLTIRLEEIDSTLSPANIVEKDFSLRVKTTTGDSFLFSPFNIRRVIMEDFNRDSHIPRDGSIETGNILFKWQPVQLNYNFSYQLEIFSLQRLELIAEINDIPSDSSQYLLQDLQILNNLDAEDNIWSLYIIDSLGNRNKSHFNLFNYSK